MSANSKIKVIIMGAAGRDFHNFNTCFRGNSNYEVVAFTATQIPDIAGRSYPPVLAGELYPDGIAIHDESELPDLIKKHNADQVVFAYSDVAHEYVMHKSSLVNACGADFVLMGSRETMLKSTKPLIAICAVRTGCGKSQTTRYVADILNKLGKKVAVVRHPMPYGDLAEQICQRFECLEDMDKHKCTIEEREEYEPHIISGNLVFAGVDYEIILREAEKAADVVLWDGGNNDMSFYKPDLTLTVTDPHRAGHELAYYPGEANLYMADAIVINKCDTATPEQIEKVQQNVKAINPGATLILADSPVKVDSPDQVKGKTVLVVEDGPTLTHGQMTFGAGHVAARNYGAATIVDPRPFAQGSIKSTYEKYNHLTDILPAMGYGTAQMQELQETINRVPCDLVLVGTPIDLAALLKINKPSLRVYYDLQERQNGVIKSMVEKIL